MPLNRHEKNAQEKETGGAGEVAGEVKVFFSWANCLPELP